MRPGWRLLAGEQETKSHSFLLILIFLITPVVEEVWLEEQYGEDYLKYKQTTPRFL